MIHKSSYKLFFYNFVAACFSFAYLSGAPIRYENQIVGKLNIIVEDPCGQLGDGSAVSSRIKTHEGGFFSQSEFDTDLKALASEYDRVEPRFEVVDGKLYIQLRVWPRPTIRSICWNGNQEVTKQRLQKELAITICSVYDRESFNKAFHKLKAYYVRKGFFEAQLDYKVNRDEETNQVDIEILICEGRTGRIKDILFCNFFPCEEDDLLGLIYTKKFNIFTSWLNNEGTYNEDAIRQDQLITLDYLQNRGFADAKVSIDVSEAVQKNRILVTFTLERGKRYYFGSIAFEGNTLFTKEEIASCLTIEEGKPYSPNAIRETVKNIINLYGKYGYIDASVNFEPVLDCDHRTYKLQMKIEEGNQYRVGMIKIFGNCATQNSVILHETLLIPGEIFNLCKLQKTEERLKNIGFFKNVNVYAVKGEGPCSLGDTYRDVHIEVEETCTGNFGAHFGFSSAERLFGGLSLTERNFNWRGVDRWWQEGYQAMRGGGEYAHLNATVGTKSTRYTLSWMKPHFNDTQCSFGFDIDRSNNRYISERYNIQTGTLSLRSFYDCNQWARVGWHYRIKNSYIHIDHHQLKKDYNEQVKLWQEREDPSDSTECPQYRKNQKLIEEAERSGIVSATGVTFMYDSTNNPTFPTNGFRSRLMLEFAGLGGHFRFLSMAYLNTWFFPLEKITTLKVRADIRLIQPLESSNVNHLPLDERLFLGGDSVIRGYRAYRIGPVFDWDKEEPKGGVSLGLFSVEINQRWHERLETFGFFDAGQISEYTWHFGYVYTSIGCGARIKILPSIPAITLGYGVPLNAKNNSQVKRFFIQMGGSF
jgi:outer membrane protein insertion porin family